MSRFFLTTPIYYVNDVPHIGTAYTTLAADILARFHRARGEEVLFSTGTDEHATKVLRAAEARGMNVREFVDGMAGRFQEAWRELGVDDHVFIRTSEARHIAAGQEFFRRLQERGDIYQGEYEGWYCVGCETFFAAEEAPEKEGVRPCPNEPQHKPLELVRETNYFFALSRYGDRLLEWIDANPGCLLPEFRKNEVVSFIKQGLRDVCITRSAVGWGIPVPDDDSQVIYVWFDALINYITVAGFPNDAESMDAWWPASLHLVGKDIYVRFHCTLWPAMLMAAGLKPPRCVFGHGFWMNEGTKMSKSLGNFIEPLKLAEWLETVSGSTRPIARDAVRYFLFREMPFGEDGNFSRSSLVQRFNGDLANDLGNGLNRALNMVRQNFVRDGAPDGETPPPSDAEVRLKALAPEIHARVTASLEAIDLQGALTAIWDYVAALNGYIGERAPWVLARQGKRDELAGVLRHALEGARVLTVWLSPVMPVASREMRAQLGLSSTPTWEEALQWDALQTGAPLGSPVPIFPRIDRKRLEEGNQIMSGETPQSVAPAAPAATPAPPAPTAEAPQQTEGIATIGIDDFAKVELRVAVVLSAERVPKADKLLHLKVSLGDEERTVLAGLAEYYQPETLVGRRVVMVANLAPRKLRGLISQGMLLAAEADGKVSLLQPDTELPAGARIR